MRTVSPQRIASSRVAGGRAGGFALDGLWLRLREQRGELAELGDEARGGREERPLLAGTLEALAVDERPLRPVVRAREARSRHDRCR